MPSRDLINFSWFWFSVFAKACYLFLPPWPTVPSSSVPNAIPRSWNIPNRTSWLSFQGCLRSIISHPYCLVCFRPSVLSYLCYHNSLPAGFSTPMVSSPWSCQGVPLGNFLSHNCNQGPHFLRNLWWLTLPRWCYHSFLSGCSMGCVGCTSTLHPTPFSSGRHSFYGSHECHSSSRMVRIEARTQMLISAFLVYFIAFHLTRQFQKHAPPL